MKRTYSTDQTNIELIAAIVPTRRHFTISCWSYYCELGEPNSERRYILIRLPLRIGIFFNNKSSASSVSSLPDAYYRWLFNGYGVLESGRQCGSCIVQCNLRLFRPDFHYFRCRNADCRNMLVTESIHQNFLEINLYLMLCPNSSNRAESAGSRTFE